MNWLPVLCVWSQVQEKDGRSQDQISNEEKKQPLCLGEGPRLRKPLRKPQGDTWRNRPSSTCPTPTEGEEEMGRDHFTGKTSPGIESRSDRADTRPPQLSYSSICNSLGDAKLAALVRASIWFRCPTRVSSGQRGQGCMFSVVAHAYADEA